MAEAGDGSGHTPLTPEWTPAPRASHYPWQGDRPAAAPSLVKVYYRDYWLRVTSGGSDSKPESWAKPIIVLINPLRTRQNTPF